MKPSAAPPHLEFRRRESVRNGILRLARTLAAAAAAQTTRPAAECDSAVHTMRLLLKRARSLVRLLASTRGGTPLKRHDRPLRAAARRLADTRDRTVGRNTLRQIEREADAQRRDAVRIVGEHYATKRKAPVPSDARVSAALAGAAKALRTFSDRLPGERWKGHGWTALAPGLRAAFRRARRRFERAHTDSPEEAFHRWRIAVKSLRYHTTLFRPAAPKRLRGLVREFDRLGAGLGNAHDLAVLDARLARWPATFGGAEVVAPVRAILANRQQYQRKQAIKLGRKLLAQRPAHFVESLHRAWESWRRS